MVQVICRSCEFKHSASERDTRNENDVGYCPSCGSIRAKYVDKEKSIEEIKNELLEINGVHDNILSRIEDEYGSVSAVQNLRPAKLESVKGIGKKTAKRITEKV